MSPKETFYPWELSRIEKYGPKGESERSFKKWKFQIMKADGQKDQSERLNGRKSSTRKILYYLLGIALIIIEKWPLS